MTDITDNFVRQQLVEQRRAPTSTTGVIGWLRTRLFASPGYILLTIISALILWYTIVPAFKFLFVDAVWTGKDRTDCLAENVGHPVGACWPYVTAKINQFLYGFYPQDELWRPNLVFVLAAGLLAPLLIPRMPAKGVNALLFFGALPVVGFFLLHGGGIQGFGAAWFADLLSTIVGSISDVGRRLAATGDAMHIAGLSQLVWLIGKAIALVGLILSYVIWPFVALRGLLQASAQPVWTDFAVTAIIVSALMFGLNGGIRNGGRSLITSVIVFGCIGVVIWVMGLTHHGLPVVDTRSWGGLLVTLVVSITGIVSAMPIGIVLALGRRSQIPLIRVFSITFIEFWRGVPLITVLFFAAYMLPFFLPADLRIDPMVRVLVGVAIFSGAYMAEVVRGGLAAIPRGQREAASALGLSYWRTTLLIVLPQALRLVIPNIVSSFIGLFKDTTLVLTVAIFDLLGQIQASFADPVWSTPTTQFTGFAFAGLIYFTFCFSMSRYALSVERRLNAYRRN